MPDVRITTSAEGHGFSLVPGRTIDLDELIRLVGAGAVNLSEPVETPEVAVVVETPETEEVIETPEDHVAPIDTPEAAKPKRRTKR
ncbi:hypothetical protein [Hansschlegelia beijingensis]|uniref:Uncharacterized protein n=1 Tax=Hansschlegelia beijingensis TaxID=1133344 RepID=A0A7W6CX71_9HYPH|nr:hypothetical protein [Hansschlegelia beijingensis]MBB3972775.1 hypothetical protein [Hansschlegelia beijingensis]